MEHQMEKKIENEMEAGGIWGFKEHKLNYYIGETLLFTIYTLMVSPQGRTLLFRVEG